MFFEVIPTPPYTAINRVSKFRTYTIIFTPSFKLPVPRPLFPFRMKMISRIVMPSAPALIPDETIRASYIGRTRGLVIYTHFGQDNETTKQSRLSGVLGLVRTCSDKARRLGTLGLPASHRTNKASSESTRTRSPRAAGVALPGKSRPSRKSSMGWEARQDACFTSVWLPENSFASASGEVFAYSRSPGALTNRFQEPSTGRVLRRTTTPGDGPTNNAGNR